MDGLAGDMARGRDFAGFRVRPVALASAGLLARLGAAGRFRLGPFAPVMAQGGNGDGLAAQFRAADGAIDHCVIAARLGAGGRDFVFADGLAGAVARGRDDGIFLCKFGFGVGVREILPAFRTVPIFDVARLRAGRVRSGNVGHRVGVDRCSTSDGDGAR